MYVCIYIYIYILIDQREASPSAQCLDVDQGILVDLQIHGALQPIRQLGLATALHGHPPGSGGYMLWKHGHPPGGEGCLNMINMDIYIYHYISIFIMISR